MTASIYLRSIDMAVMLTPRQARAIADAIDRPADMFAAREVQVMIDEQEEFSALARRAKKPKKKAAKH